MDCNRPPIVSDQAGILSGLVGNVDRFSCEKWGRSTLRLEGSDHGFPLTIDAVDRMVTSAIRVPAIRLVEAGTRIPSSHFCSPVRIGSQTLNDVADPQRVLDLYRRGATIVLQSLHRTWSPVSAWCAGLERELGWPVQCNVYLTPPNAAGFARHADGHDVFVVQLDGAKRWNIADLGSVRVTTGDVLYLPAGTDHEAGTDASPSLHATIGVHRPTTDAVIRAVMKAADPAPVEPVPIGGTPEATEAAVEAAAAAGRAAIEQVDLATVASSLSRHRRRHQQGLLASSFCRPTIDDDTMIGLTVESGVAIDLDEELGDGRLRCTWTDGALIMPAVAHPAMQRIAALHDEPNGELRVADLPGLDSDGRRVLVRRLADEGLLVVY